MKIKLTIIVHRLSVNIIRSVLLTLFLHCKQWQYVNRKFAPFGIDIIKDLFWYLPIVNTTTLTQSASTFNSLRIHLVSMITWFLSHLSLISTAVFCTYGFLLHVPTSRILLKKFLFVCHNNILPSILFSSHETKRTWFEGITNELRTRGNGK